MISEVLPLILSGGVGMRLWPISRVSNPKQLMDLGDGTNMLQNTLTRLKKIEKTTKPIITCNERHRLKVEKQLQQINLKSRFIIVEPVLRGTAPALIAALIRLNEIEKKDQICLLMPSDHYVGDIASFSKVIKEGSKYVKDGNIVTFGIIPTYPEPGYGYIKKGSLLSTSDQKDYLAFSVKKFVEKPDIETAKVYLNSSEYFWNSGIFMFSSRHILEEFKHFIPDTVQLCKLAVAKGNKKSNFFYLEKTFFSKCSKNSIDHALMEKTNNIVVIPMNVNWRDLGSWSSLLEASNKDVDGNVLKGEVIAYDTQNSYVHAESRLVTTVGLNKHIVIETSDSVLVVPSSKTQEVKGVVAKLRLHEKRKVNQKSLKCHFWGSCEKLFDSETVTITLIIINPGNFVDLELNFKPGVNWLVIDGQGVISGEKSKFCLNKKDSVDIKRVLGYSVCNTDQYKVPLKIIEFRKSCSFNKILVD